MATGARTGVAGTGTAAAPENTPLTSPSKVPGRRALTRRSGTCGRRARPPRRARCRRSRSRWCSARGWAWRGRAGGPGRTRPRDHGSRAVPRRSNTTAHPPLPARCGCDLKGREPKLEGGASAGGVSCGPRLRVSAPAVPSGLCARVR